MLLAVVPRLQDFLHLLGPLSTGVEGTGRLEPGGTVAHTVVQDIDQVVPGGTGLGSLLRGTERYKVRRTGCQRAAGPLPLHRVAAI